MGVDITWTGLLLRATDPLGKFDHIRSSRRQEYHLHVLGQHDHFLPHDTTLRVVDVVDFIEYDPLDVADQVGTSVQH